MLQVAAFNSELYCSAINNTLEAVHNEYYNVCIIGNFNFPSINWTDNYNMPTLGSGGGNLFRNTMSEFGHTQINDVISNSASYILDLVFTNITEMISPISEFPCIFPWVDAWVDSEVRHLSHIKMTAWRRAKRSVKSSDVAQVYRVYMISELALNAEMGMKRI